MATFSVTAHNGEATDFEGDYSITDGVLEVRPTSGNPVIYSPSGWLSVELDVKEGIPNLLRTGG